MSTLRTLRAANSGDKTAMEGLIMKGFGRTGSRRRELMVHFVKSGGPADSDALESLLDQADDDNNSNNNNNNNDNNNNKPPPGSSCSGHPSPESPSQSLKVKKTHSGKKNSFFEKWDQPKLLQFLNSQKQQQRDTKGTTSWLGSSVKTVNPNQFVPETNIWGKPPAEVLVRTKRAHWWRRSADKMMPPLGNGEWELLRRLSSGAQDGADWAVPRRRAYPMSNAPASWEWEQYATLPIGRVEQPKTLSRQRRTGHYDAGPYGGHARSTRLSSRWFRRVYNRTWQLTAKMEQHPATLQYAITWGSASCDLPDATEAQSCVFEGLDKQGNKADSEPVS
ncbi:hypothetical protein UVI_02049470 [Ustilaginoidea virens]|nr:hypothetical protein UVI_02049470 [Ustilaginoidea virens]